MLELRKVLYSFKINHIVSFEQVNRLCSCNSVPKVFSFVEFHCHWYLEDVIHIILLECVYKFC
jgi:hypothetical protein